MILYLSGEIQKPMRKFGVMAEVMRVTKLAERLLQAGHEAGRIHYRLL